MDIIFKKEQQSLVLIAKNSIADEAIQNLINSFFLNIPKIDEKYVIDLSSAKASEAMDQLEFFYQALKDDFEIELTDKMKMALEKNVKSISVESKENEVVLLKENQEKQTRARRSNRKNKPKLESQEKGVTLSRLFGQIKQAIEQNFYQEVWLQAEIANINNSPRGHMYFELIETDAIGNEIAKNRAMLWSSKTDFVTNKFYQGTKSQLQVGQKVMFKVKVSFDIRYGLSLTISDIDPNFTLGDMNAKINKIRDELIEKNIYKKNKDLARPFIYKKVAVISPSDAAGLHDFQVDANLLHESNICEFDYYNATFQGNNTSISVRSALASVLKSKIDYDCIIIIRGGGAKTDLHYLNDTAIAEDICNCPIPVMVGIGHQIDHGILDEIANIKQDTPSKVIGYVYSSIYERLKEVGKYHKDSKNKIEQQVVYVKHNIESLYAHTKSKISSSVIIYRNQIKKLHEKNAQNLIMKIEKVKQSLEKVKEENPKLIVNLIEVSKRTIIQKRDEIKWRLENNTNKVKNELQSMLVLIKQFDPKELFKKGFNVALNKNKEPVKSVSDVKKGDDLQMYLKDGIIITEIKEVKK